MSRSTQDPASSLNRFQLQGFHLLWPGVPAGSPNGQIGNSTHAVLQPRSGKPERFGLFRFRSPLLSESRLIYFPPGTEMVHFPGLAHTRLCIQRAVLRI